MNIVRVTREQGEHVGGMVMIEIPTSHYSDVLNTVFLLYLNQKRDSIIFPTLIPIYVGLQSDTKKYFLRRS